MSPYRDIQTDMDHERSMQLMGIPVTVQILPATCGRSGPFVWGRVKWGARTYFVCGFWFLTIWI